MPDNRIFKWLDAFKATVPGQSLSALENRPNVPSHAELRVNSQQIQTGDVFLAIQGHSNHGRQYIRQALQQGAALVLTDAWPDDVDAALEQDPRVLYWPALSAVLPAVIQRFYHDAVTDMALYGITGTNGKSSTAIFIHQLTELLQQPSAVIGTLGYGHYQALTPLANTTPHLTELHRIFAQMQQQGRSHIAMEVSSHAMTQQRVAGLQFACAVFTNLTRDHLDYHGTMQAYGEAKALLFKPQQADKVVINVSDAFGRALAAQCTQPLLAYGRLADCQTYERYLGYDELRADGHGFRLRLYSHLGDFQLQIPLLAEFNVQNVLAAMGALLMQGWSLPRLVQAAAQLKPVPGRMEQWRFPDDVSVVVDYAHTPDALQQSLQALRQQCQGHLWCVFGCGGDRDKGKRPLMGQIAERFADHVIITADNPRTESVDAICQDIVAGMTTAANCQIEPDRERAIKLALIEAHRHDMILVAGKGHENYQIIGQYSRDYDERRYIDQLHAEMSR